MKTPSVLTSIVKSDSYRTPEVNNLSPATRPTREWVCMGNYGVQRSVCDTHVVLRGKRDVSITPCEGESCYYTTLLQGIQTIALGI